MFSFAQAVVLATLSASFARAFNPVFSSPRQCSSLKITWTSFDLPVDTIAVSEITMTLTPLDNDPSRIAPQPYTVAVPFAIDIADKQFDIPSLPFPGGTQFFASAYLPGASGPVRRTVSSIFTVEHSDDSSCLSSHKMPENRGRVKAFGKRQVNVIGTGVVDATQTGSPATGSSTSASGTATPVVNVIGVGTIPATGGANTDTASGTASTSAAASSSTGAIPPIRVIGTTTVPATATATATTPDTPANLAPSPSTTGAIPPVNVIGTSFITATDAPAAESSSTGSDESSTATTTVDESSSVEATATSTDCTETPIETSINWESDMPTPPMLEATMDVGDDSASTGSEEPPCTTETEASQETSTEEMTPTEEASSPYETATDAATYNTEVRAYSNMEEMVNAANSMFHAWNPYGPSYTNA